MTPSLLLPLVTLAIVQRTLSLDAAEGDVCRVDGKIGHCVHYRENYEYLLKLVKPLRAEADDQYLRRYVCNQKKGLTCRVGSVNVDTCGIQMDDRIVGGERAGIDQFPWMALLQFRNTRRGTLRFACGGALLNRRFVLTAAHCLARLPAGLELHKIRLGEWNTESEVDCENAGDETTCALPVQDFGYEQIIVHENYTGSHADRSHDIALIKLDGVVEYNPYVKPICLPDPNMTGAEKLYVGMMRAAGWGRTETASGSSFKLTVTLEHVEMDSCNRTYTTQIRSSLRESQFCAQGALGKDTCNGDSGGPLMKRIGTPYYIIGIVSFGPQMCGNPVPSVYTRVEKFYDWIASQMVLFEL